MNDAVVYQSLRDEMTAWFVSAFNFEILQYTVLSVLIAFLVQEKNITILAMKASAMIAFIYMIGLICTDLHNKATRAGSYLLVAYEIKDREDAIKGIKNDAKFQYWILANRSSSDIKTGVNTNDDFGFNREFSRFYFRQSITVLSFFILTTFLMFGPSNEKKLYNMACEDFVPFVLFFLFTILCLISICKAKEASRYYTTEQVKIWKNYFDGKSKYDQDYLDKTYYLPEPNKP